MNNKIYFHLIINFILIKNYPSQTESSSEKDNLVLMMMNFMKEQKPEHALEEKNYNIKNNKENNNEKIQKYSIKSYTKKFQ